jgi:hypothetical protein
MWAFLLIWAGIMLLGANLGWFDDIGLEAWSIGFLGAGIIVLLFAALRLVMPAYRAPIVGNLIFGVVLIAIGLGDILDWVIIWPLVLIVIGVSLLLRGFFRRQ